MEEKPKIETEKLSRQRNFWKREQLDPWSEEIEVVVNPQDLSIDELPPVGVEGPLSSEKPGKLEKTHTE